VEINVWMDHWQMDCCGVPFEVGSEVSWQLRPVTGLEWLDVVQAGLVLTVDAVEDHHGGSAPTTATVLSIATLHCRFAPEPVADSGTMATVRAANKWIEDCGDRQFAGFLMRARVSDEA
jgi:uncharacterized protein DUF6578